MIPRGQKSSMEVWGGAELVDVNSQLVWEPFFSQEQEQGRQLTALLLHPPSWAKLCLSTAGNLALNLVSLDKRMTAMYHPSLVDFYFWHHLFPFHFKVSVNCLGQK